MLVTVSSLRVAAESAPQRSEGFAFAALTSITNLATASAENVGSFLYEHAFHNNLTPLIIVSALATAVAFVLVPMLRLGTAPQPAVASDT